MIASQVTSSTTPLLDLSWVKLWEKNSHSPCVLHSLINRELSALAFAQDLVSFDNMCDEI
jgi:hypothetical protein